MKTRVLVQKNTYHDSVALMSLSGKINQLEGIQEAVISMGTTMNKQLLENVGMLSEEAAASTENDLILAVQAVSDKAIDHAFQMIDEQFKSKKGKANKGEQLISTWRGAIQALPEANLAVLSVPGEHAAREARKAIENNLNVMIFSDNVSLEDEKQLKDLAAQKGLLVMGPDCGTAIINGVGLCFANRVHRGSIGLVAASGTGLQEVTVQIHRLGYGISQAIGTGGRDLHETIGGTMMIEGIRALLADDETEVLVVISKPPKPEVQRKVLQELKNSPKPIVACFLDGDAAEIENAGIMFAPTLFDAAVMAVGQLSSQDMLPAKSNFDALCVEADRQKQLLHPEQKDIRGLFCGGTLTSEALSILRKEGLELKSNVAKKETEKLESIKRSVGHTLIDLGDDEFTLGKPHPMIEPSLRNERILQEAADPRTAVLYLDFELGYGSHEDPVGESISVIREAKNLAEKNGRFLPIVAYICGTELDKQNKALQTRTLKEAGVILADSNKEAALIAARLVGQGDKGGL